MKQPEPTFTLRDKLNELKDVYFSGYVSINELSEMVKGTPSQVNQLINMNGVIKSTHKLINWSEMIVEMRAPTIKDFNRMTEQEKSQY